MVLKGQSKSVTIFDNRPWRSLVVSFFVVSYNLAMMLSWLQAHCVLKLPCGKHIDRQVMPRSELIFISSLILHLISTTELFSVAIDIIIYNAPLSFLVKAETITGLETQLTEQPCGNAQLSIFSFVSLKIKGGVAVQTWLTWDYWRTVINNHNCWPGKRGRGKKDKCYLGNTDLELNMPVTVIEECLCVGMSCTNMRLCMRQWAWQEKWLKTNNALWVTVWRALGTYSTLLFCLEHVCCALSVYHILVLHTETVC